jgi:hypothetical protein
MPVLLWVAFWSSLLGTATCFIDKPKPVPAKVPARE